MEIVKTDRRAITLESYSIERETNDAPVTVRAELQISAPDEDPARVRIRLKYQTPAFPTNRDEREFARRLLQRLRYLIDEP